MTSPRGTLWLVPTPLDFKQTPQPPLAQVLPGATLAQAAKLTHWIGESAKSTRAFLQRVAAEQPLAAPLQAMTIAELPRAAHKHGDHQPNAALDEAARALLAPALQGHDMGLASEAGLPAVADPGASVVRAAHALGVAVQPLPGASSITLALAASGLNGQHFAFVGYLPTGAARAAQLRTLERTALRLGQTQVCIETPYRNAALLADLLQHLQPSTRLALAANLGQQPQVRLASVAQWRRHAWAAPETPCVFMWGP